MPELTLALKFPLLQAHYDGEAVVADLPLASEESLLIFQLDRLDTYDALHRERCLLQVGEQLFQTLISPRVMPLYLKARAEQQGSGSSLLRIRVQADDPQLLALPWEFFYDGRNSVFPASAPNTPLVRTLGTPRAGQALSPTTSLRLMLVGASPKDEQPVRFSQELEAIQQAALKAGIDTRVLVGPETSPKRLMETLADFQPHIFHFMGHGYASREGTGLKLEDRQGRAYNLKAEMLAGWLKAAPPCLVVLNACESGKLAQRELRGALATQILSSGVPALLAMQYRVPDAASVVFGKAFFQHLFDGSSLERSVQAGRHALLVEGGLMERHFATPVLYLATEEGGNLLERSELANSEQTALQRPSHKIKPFRYLESFSRQDQALFFGRARAIESLVNLIATHRLSVVHGHSGVGKTSLVQAGLEQSPSGRLYHTVILRVVNDPLESVEQALKEAVLPPQAGAHPSAVPQPPSPGYRSASEGPLVPVRSGLEPLPEEHEVLTASLSGEVSPLLQRLKVLQEQTGRTVLLIFDQFEELFTLLKRDQQKTLLTLLHQLYGEASLRLRLVLVLREDFFGGLEGLRSIFPTILHHTLPLSALTQDEARDALIGPLRTLGYAYDPEVVEAILSELCEQQVEPAPLQIVAYQLFEECEKQGKPGLWLETYNQLGRAAGLLTRHVEQVFQTLTPADRETAQLMLECFVTPQGTRQPGSARELARSLSLAPERVERLLHRLGEARILRRLDPVDEQAPIDKQYAARWELVHEALIQALGENVASRSRLEMKALRRRLQGTRLLAVSLATVLVLLGLGYLLSSHPVGLRFALQAPTAGEWELILYQGQRRCDEKSTLNTLGAPGSSPDQAVGTPPLEQRIAFSGQHKALYFLAAGDYEATLRSRNDSSAPPLYFALKVDLLGMQAVQYPPKPILWVEGVEFVYIPGGTFEPAGNAHTYLREIDSAYPQDQLYVVRPFYMSRTEVTRAQFRRFIQQSRYKTLSETSPKHYCTDVDRRGAIVEGTRTWQDPKEGIEEFIEDARVASRPLTSSQLEALPVVYLDEEDIQEYAKWMSARAKRRVRLPMELEWLFAARGVDHRLYPWGGCIPLAGEANLRLDIYPPDPYPELGPVGSFPGGRSPFGILDMVGNVKEPLADCYTMVGQTFRPSSGKCDIVRSRGGTFAGEPSYGNTYLSAHARGPSCVESVGLRLVLDPNAPLETPAAAPPPAPAPTPARPASAP